MNPNRRGTSRQRDGEIKRFPSWVCRTVSCCRLPGPIRMVGIWVSIGGIRCSLSPWLPRPCLTQFYRKVIPINWKLAYSRSRWIWRFLDFIPGSGKWREQSHLRKILLRPPFICRLHYALIHFWYSKSSVEFSVLVMMPIASRGKFSVRIPVNALEYSLILLLQVNTSLTFPTGA